jgi:hypothetical protein
MEDRETPQMCKYGESKMTRIMMATVRHVTSSWALGKFPADGFLFDGVYMWITNKFKVLLCSAMFSVISYDNIDKADQNTLLRA